MKTAIKLSVIFFVFVWHINSQTLQQAANWPNANWSLNATGQTDNYLLVNGNPTTDNFFSYNDRARDGLQTVSAESPIIDLTQANAAGENFIYLSLKYSKSAHDSNNRFVGFQYWDADTSSWIDWYELPEEETEPGIIHIDISNYLHHKNLFTPGLDISNFTVNQLSGFRYRLVHKDNNNNNLNNFIVYFSSPTIQSSAVNYFQPEASISVSNNCNYHQFSVDINITDLGNAPSVIVYDNQGNTSQPITSVPTTITFGPYDSMLKVNISVANSDITSIQKQIVARSSCAPINDEYYGAIDIVVNQDDSCTQKTYGTTFNATHSYVPDNGNYLDGSVNQDVWFKFTATRITHKITIMRQDRLPYVVIDNRVSLGIYYMDSNNNLVFFGQPSDIGIIQSLTPGKEYYIRAHPSRYNSFQICVSNPNIAINDGCENAINLQVNPDLNPTYITHINGYDSTNSTNSSAYYGDTLYSDVWCTFTATSTKHFVVTFNAQPEGHQYNSSDIYWAGVSLYSGSCGALNEVAAADVGFYDNLVVGQTYYLKITTSGDNMIAVMTPPTQSAVPPNNDECSGAITLTPSSNLICTNVTHGTTDGAIPSQYNWNDVWYKFTATSTSHVVYLKNLSYTYPQLQLPYQLEHIISRMRFYKGDCGNLDDDVNHSLIKDGVILKDLVIGDTYYVNVRNVRSILPIDFDICVATFQMHNVSNNSLNTAIDLPVNNNNICSNIFNVNNGTEISLGNLYYKFTATSTSHIVSLTNIRNIADNSLIDKSDFDAYNYLSNLQIGFVNTFHSRFDNNSHLIKLESFLSNLNIGQTYYIKIELNQLIKFDICITSYNSPPPPPNNLCEDAIEIIPDNNFNCLNPIHGTTNGSTTIIHQGSGVWYKFTATKSEYYAKIDNVHDNINGDDEDLGFRVFSGNCNNLAEVIVTGHYNFKEYHFYTNPGETYYIQVCRDTYYGTLPFDFDMCVFYLDTFPINDDPENAIDLPINTDTNCTDIIHATSLNATRTRKITEGTTTVCYNPLGDVWFTFTATQTKHIITVYNAEFSFFNTSFNCPLEGKLYYGNLEVLSPDIRIGRLIEFNSIYSSFVNFNNNDTPKNMVFLNDDGFNIYADNLTVGRKYYLRVFGQNIDFDVCVKSYPDLPVNDECTNAINLPVNTDTNCNNVIQATNIGATASPQFDDVAGNPDDDVWFSFEASSTVHTISLNNFSDSIQGVDTLMGLGVYSGDCNNLNLIKTSYDDSNSITFGNLTPGDTYYVRVYGFHKGFTSNQSKFDICVGTPNPPIINNDFDDAIPIVVNSATLRSGACNYQQAWTVNDVVTDSGMDSSCDGIYTGLDVFYTWTATSDQLLWNGGAGDPGIVIRDTNGNEITCASAYAPDDTILSGWNIGDELIIQIYDYVSNITDVSFCLKEHGNINEVKNNKIAGLTYYPNPVNHILTLSAKQNINSIKLFNVVGQKIISFSPNTFKTQIDLSKMKKGVYFVKVKIGKQYATFKIIKN